MSEVVEDIACTICGCVCDDLRITVSDGRITRAERACILAEPWLLSQESRSPPPAEIDGRAATTDEAIARAAEILAEARAPLIYGLSRSSTPGQRAACRLADRLGATIDTTASLCHAPSIMALQEVGESTCTLGEIRNRADLVIYWGSNPLVSHPRHLERYAVDPVGMFVPAARQGRTLVVVDVQPTITSALANVFLQVESDSDFDVLWTLLALVRGVPVREDAAVGAPLAQLKDLARRMKSCRCGVIFFGLGLTRRGLGHRNVEALLRLVEELNHHTRFHARRMRVYGDVQAPTPFSAGKPVFPSASTWPAATRATTRASIRPTTFCRGVRPTPACSSAAKACRRFRRRRSSACSEFPPSPWITPRWPLSRRRPSGLRPRSTAFICPARRTAWTKCRSSFARCCPPVRQRRGCLASD